MTPVFADTYFWLALINPRDQAHQEAVALSQLLTQPLVTTAWVLTYVGDTMCVPVNRPAFVKLLESIANDSQTEVVAAEQNWFDLGVELYTARPDKKWSLTDCISFVVMRDMGLTEALTADSDFTQGGFRILMKSTQ
jgi:predicted nucleic acid-binding protein